MSSQILKLLILAAVTVWTAVGVMPDGKLHVVVCDVGQGDAILIIRGTSQILVDGGPGREVLGCLADHIPFYDRRLEAVVLTHPQSDHYGGLSYVFESYRVLLFVSGPEGSNSGEFEKLTKMIRDSGAKQANLYAGEEMKVDGINFTVVWPTREYMVLGAGSDGTDVNAFAITGVVKYGDFDMLLTGDADSQVQDDQLRGGRIGDVDVLKVPHHGGKAAMNGNWLGRISPELAVISVGKNNSYGHPRQETLKLLTEAGVKVMRTDSDGDVEVVSDGKRWWVK